MDALNRIAVPNWFIEMTDTADAIMKETTDLLGDDVAEKIRSLANDEQVTEKDAMEEMMKMGKELKEEGREPSPEMQQQIMVMQQYVSALRELAWARFRYENKDNKFGLSILKYNKEGNYIEAKDDAVLKS